MGRKPGPVRRAEWREKAYDPKNWKSWSPAYQKKVYGDERYQENLEASYSARFL